MLLKFFGPSPRVVNLVATMPFAIYCNLFEQVGQRVSDFLWCRLGLESLDDLALF